MPELHTPLAGLSNPDLAHHLRSNSPSAISEALARLLNPPVEGDLRYRDALQRLQMAVQVYMTLDGDDKAAKLRALDRLMEENVKAVAVLR